MRRYIISDFENRKNDLNGEIDRLINLKEPSFEDFESAYKYFKIKKKLIDFRRYQAAVDILNGKKPE